MAVHTAKQLKLKRKFSLILQQNIQCSGKKKYKSLIAQVKHSTTPQGVEMRAENK